MCESLYNIYRGTRLFIFFVKIGGPILCNFEDLPAAVAAGRKKRS